MVLFNEKSGVFAPLFRRRSRLGLESDELLAVAAVPLRPEIAPAMVAVLLLAGVGATLHLMRWQRAR